MKWYHKLGIIIFIVGVVFVCLNVIPIKYKISKTVKGVKWEFDNAELQETVSITIDGEYTRYVLHFFDRSDYFEGTFSVSGYEFTQSTDTFLFRVNFDYGFYNMATLHYGGSQAHPVLGTIYSDKQMSQGVILLNDKLTDSQMQQVISFPCEDRAQASLLARKLLPEGFQFD